MRAFLRRYRTTITAALTVVLACLAAGGYLLSRIGDTEQTNREQGTGIARTACAEPTPPDPQPEPQSPGNGGVGGALEGVGNGAAGAVQGATSGASETTCKLAPALC